jgi:Flp pilus assembly protein TadG
MGMKNTHTEILAAAPSEVRAGVRFKSHGAARRFRAEDGQSLVEFALVLPMLLMLVVGAAVFGIALNQYLTLTNATNISAQTLAISRLQTSDPCNLTTTTFYAAAPDLTHASLNFTILLNGIDVGGTTCTAGAADMLQGAPASVTVTYPCNLTILGVNFAPSGCTLSAQTSESIQ